MKTLTKTIYTLLFALALFISGSFISEAAGGQFDPNPSGGSTQFVSIKSGNACSNCANQQNSISANVPNPGDTSRFTVYMDFRNKGTATIYNAKGRMVMPSSGGTISGTLSGQGASSITDTAFLTNLPSSYDINFVSGYVENTHGTTDPIACAGYNQHYNIGSEVLGNGAQIGDLDTVYNGWCDQGYVIATFEIENTGQTAPTLDIQTNNATNVTTTSAVLNGRVNTGNNVTVKFAFGTNSNPSCNGSTVNVNGTYNAGQNFSATKSGLQSNTTYYFKACGQSGTQSDEGEVRNFTTGQTAPTAQVQTNSATNITTNSARLNGEVLSGNNIQVWFALTTSSNTTNCSSQGQTVAVGGTYDAGQPFLATAGSLQPDTTYFFRACGRTSFNTPPVSGLERSFTTQQTTTNYTYDWKAGGWGACNNNIQVREYSCVRYPGGVEVSDSLCIQNVGPKPYETRTCGTTGNNLSVETLGATNVGISFATLNGRVTGGNTRNVYFVYNRQFTSLNCNNVGNALYPIDFNVPRIAGDNFQYTFPAGSLQPNTEYHYRACASASGSTGPQAIAQGLDVKFKTDDNGGSTSSPQAETQRASDVREDSARLNGQIRMNDFQDGIVFFVYGRDGGRIGNTASTYNSYNDARNNESGDDFRVEQVDPDNDSASWRSYSTNLRSLRTDERYHFEICVEYRQTNNNTQLVCGQLETFRTERDGGGGSNNQLEIRTDNPRSVTQTTAEMCGTLIDDGGERRRTYLEFRENNGGSFTSTPERQRGEGQFCERVSGLIPNTIYAYRACADGQCANERTFKTIGTIQQGIAPNVDTNLATDIRSNYALLRGTYVANADRATVWFNYGRSQGLGSETRRQTVNGAYGEFTHPFTGLASNTTYYYQAAIQTVNGFDTGAIYSFRTNGGGIIISQPPVIVVQDNNDIDLSSLGLGLSLIRLDIDDQEEVIVRDESLTYEVEWENISQLDLFNLNLKVVFPPEIQVTNVSRGRFDQKTNTLYYTIDELLPGEQDRLTVNAIVGPGTIGTLIVAEAEIAYDNPINDAQENAKDFDLDEYGAQFAGVTASVFGLGNITFLGWLVILLGLFIIFLIARWLYLEREEMRAQAYASGYRPYVAGPGYDAYGQPIAQMPVYQQPQYNVPPAAPAAPQNDYYEPYRPNRG